MVDGDGMIVATELLEDGETLPPQAAHLGGPIIPGFPNVHSHAFQRGMAGLAEWPSGAEDSFWSWRDTMYRFVAALQPEDILAIAEFLYCELLTHGYTCVGEFHYLHRDPQGCSYDDPALLSRGLLQAAENTGIGITLLPTLYTYGGCGKRPLADSQRRFRTTADEIVELLEAIRQVTRDQHRQRAGIAAHSLRAIDPEEFRELLDAARQLDPTLPVHLHVAEQQREVDECLAWSERRPVAWVAEHLPLDERWCLIHATHVMASELEAMRQSGATVGMCPTTEANLGDGVFPAKRWLELGGHLAIGSDSHVSVSPFEELCELEYLQRLVYQQRNVLATSGQSTGRSLAEHAWSAGARACGQPIGQISPGYRADFLVLNTQHPLLAGREGDTWLDSVIFAGDPRMIGDVFVGGERLVRAGRHPHMERAAGEFQRTMQRLLPQLG